MAGFEPDSIVINDADYGNRHVEVARGNRSDVIERSIRRSIQYLIAPNRGHSRRFIRGNNSQIDGRESHETSKLPGQHQFSRLVDRIYHCQEFGRRYLIGVNPGKQLGS
jgi:hypothetical protein